MRTSSRLPSELVLPPPNWWDAALLCLLGAILALGPAAFGGVDARTELALMGLAAALSLCLAVRPIFDRDFRLRWTWAYVPAALWLILAACQLIELPASWVQSLNPAVAATRAELLGDDAGTTARLSMYPWATAHGLRLGLIAATAFVAVVNVARSPQMIRRLLTVAFVIGIAEAGLAVAQIFTGATKLYWTYDAENQSLTAGSFVNYGNFSQFMNLSIGCGAALVLVALHVRRGRQRSYSMSGTALWDEVGWMLVGLGLCAISVLTSLSRNGAASLIVAAAIVGVALYFEGTLSRRGWMLAAVPLGVLLAFLFFGFDALYERFDALAPTRAFEDRWQLTLATLRSWQASPAWGWGLGAHEVVFPRFDPTPAPVLAQHADNDYAQLLEETGVLGAAAVVSFFAIIGAAAVRSMRHGRTPTSFAAFGLALGLIAVAIHSATDFGLRLPANFCLLALVCGLIAAIDRWERDASAVDKSGAARSQFNPRTRRMTAALLACAGLIAAWHWAAKGAYAAYRGEQWWAAHDALDARLQRRPAEADELDWIDMIAAAEHAVDVAPGNVHYLYGLNLSRWLLLNAVLGGAVEPGELDSDVRDAVERIADELRDAHQVCPTFGPPYSLEGQLRLFVLGQSQGAALIRRGVELAPYDSATTLIAGKLAAAEGSNAEARRLLRRAVQLDWRNFSEAARTMLIEMDRPAWAEDLAGKDFDRLMTLAALCRGDERFTQLSPKLQAIAEAALRARAAGDTASPNQLAYLARTDAERKDWPSAVALYRRALASDYAKVEWHLALAHALTAAGQLDEAEHETRICLRLSPRHAGAIQLLEQLSVRTK